MAQNPVKNKDTTAGLDFGQAIRKWRTDAGYPSALALFKAFSDKPFSFSYNTYMEFEKGARIPDVSQTLEMADRYGVTQEWAVLLWAKSQMPTTKLRAVFEGDQMQKVSQTPSAGPALNAVRLGAFDLDGTWVFDEEDREMISRDPWLLDFCQILATAYPVGLGRGDFEALDESKWKILISQILLPWLKKGRVILKNEILSLGLPHWYVPKTKDWFPLRLKGMLRTLQALGEQETQGIMAASESQSTLDRQFSSLHRNLDPGAKRQVIERLKALESLFLSLPNHPRQEGGSDDQEVYSLLLAFGSRKLKLFK